MKIIIALFALVFPLFSMANGDTLESACMHSMNYTIAVQIAGNAKANVKIENTNKAYEEGVWLGVDNRGTDSMIQMSSKSIDSKKFAEKYTTNEDFASSFRNSFISGCHSNPTEYIVK